MAVATSQYGVISAVQLRKQGLRKSTIAAYAAAALLHRIHHGVYALTPPQLLTPLARRMAAVLAAGPGAALSHESAAAHHGLIPTSKPRLHVAVPSHNGRSRPNLTIHRSTTLRPQDVTLVNRIPTTTVARTLLDLAEHLQPQKLTRAIDRAITLNRFDLNAVREQLTHNHARIRPATGLHKALASYAPANAPTWNDFEELFLKLVQQAGLPRPEIQPHLDLHDGEPMIQPDFLWPDRKLIVEMDSWAFHGGRERFERDRRRDQRAAAAGYRTLRFTWLQLTGEPTRVVSTLAAAA